MEEKVRHTIIKNNKESTVQKEVQRLKNELKEAIKLYRSLLDEKNNKSDKSNKS
jgi:DNA-binding ferritin-like protein